LQLCLCFAELWFAIKMKAMAFQYACISLLAVSIRAMDVNWREKLVPSFEADHADVKWEAPGAASFKKVTEALQQIQINHNITEDLLSKLPGLPQTTTFNMTMSDGVEIWTRVVNPWPYDAKKPACLVRSPYGSLATQNLALLFLVLNGHAAVMQETRGTWSSGGVFDMWRGSAKDARDTIDWIAKQPWSTEEVYSMGASSDGIDAIEEVIEKPKELHGEWLIWTTGNGHHFVYPGGAYRKDLLLGYFDSLRPVTRGASTDLVLPATQKNEAQGPWWYNLTDCGSRVDPTVAPGCRYKNVKWPMLLSAGWWDLFHHTMLDAWYGLREQGDPTFRDDHVLIVAPLGHNIAGNLDTGLLESARLKKAEVDALVVGGELTSEFWRWSKCSEDGAACTCQGRVRFGFALTRKWSAAKVVRGSIQCNTKNFGNPAFGLPKECQCQQATGKLRQRIGRVNLFIMGSFGLEVPARLANYWTSLEDFPKPSLKHLFLREINTLGDSAPVVPALASYRYDPADPPPMIGGNNLPAIGHIHYSASADQSPRENRSDVLIFDSSPLSADLAVVGAVSATVWVSSSANDTDFFVTVSDVHADGTKSMLVRYGIQRMRWRDSESTKSAPMVAGKSYETHIKMGFTAYIFPKGHRIRVSVSSAAAPYYVPTSNTGENDMTTKAKPVVAQNTVHFATNMPSRLTLPVVSAQDIPENPNFTAVGPFVEPSAELLMI